MSAAQQQIGILREPVVNVLTTAVLRMFLLAVNNTAAESPQAGFRAHQLAEHLVDNYPAFEFDEDPKTSVYICTFADTEDLPPHWMQCDMTELRHACFRVHKAIHNLLVEWKSVLKASLSVEKDDIEEYITKQVSFTSSFHSLHSSRSLSSFTSIAPHSDAWADGRAEKTTPVFQQRRL